MYKKKKKMKGERQVEKGEGRWQKWGLLGETRRWTDL